jgi:hypothetical protein
MNDKLIILKEILDGHKSAVIAFQALTVPFREKITE